MVLDGLLPIATMLEEFDHRTVKLDPALRVFMRQHLVHYGASKPTASPQQAQRN